MAANAIETPELKLVAEKTTMDGKIAELRRKRTKIELGGASSGSKASRGRPAHGSRARGEAR